MFRYRTDRDGVFRCVRSKGSIQVSLRLSPTVYQIIDEYEGKNFTDKLHNLVFDMKYRCKCSDHNM